jgi:hypothetical protein
VRKRRIMRKIRNAHSIGNNVLIYRRSAIVSPQYQIP